MNFENARTTLLSNGYKIPLLAVGTSNCTDLEVIVDKAIDIGYRLIDTAFFYKNEAIIGKTLKTAFEVKKIKREDLFIVSKLWCTQHNPADVKPTIKKSLEDLQLDHLDLYLIHNPCATKVSDTENDLEDTSVTIEDTWRAMEELVNQGYTKSIGLSNFNSQQIERILKIAKIKPVVNQVECHPYLNQEKLRAFCKQRGIFIMAYSPLKAPAKSDKPEYKNMDVFQEPIVQEMAKKYKKSVPQIILRYLIQLGETVPIPRTSNVDHLKSNFDIWDFDIVPEDLEKIKTLNRNARFVDWTGFKKFRDYPFNIEF